MCSLRGYLPALQPQNSVLLVSATLPVLTKVLSKQAKNRHADAHAAGEPEARRADSSAPCSFSTSSQHPALFLVADNADPTEEEMLKIREFFTLT